MKTDEGGGKFWKGGEGVLVSMVLQGGKRWRGDSRGGKEGTCGRAQGQLGRLNGGRGAEGKV